MNNKRTSQRRGDGPMLCWNCGQLLPADHFALYPSGTRRGVCRHCKYELYDRRAARKWRLRQLAERL